MPQKGWLHAIGTTEIYRRKNGNIPHTRWQYATRATTICRRNDRLFHQNLACGTVAHANHVDTVSVSADASAVGGMARLYGSPTGCEDGDLCQEAAEELLRVKDLEKGNVDFN